MQIALTEEMGGGDGGGAGARGGGVRCSCRLMVGSAAPELELLEMSLGGKSFWGPASCRWIDATLITLFCVAERKAKESANGKGGLTEWEPR